LAVDWLVVMIGGGASRANSGCCCVLIDDGAVFYVLPYQSNENLTTKYKTTIV